MRKVKKPNLAHNKEINFSGAYVPKLNIVPEDELQKCNSTGTQPPDRETILIEI